MDNIRTGCDTIFGHSTVLYFFFPPVISNQSNWILYELMCWLSLVVRSPPARRSLSWIQSTVDWCMALRKWGFDLKSNSTNYPRPWSPRGSSPHKENPHGRAGNRTRDLVISSQKLWPLDHEAGQRNLKFNIALLCPCPPLTGPYPQLNTTRMKNYVFKIGLWNSK